MTHLCGNVACSSIIIMIDSHPRLSKVQNAILETPEALRAARQAFPVLEMLSRWAWDSYDPTGAAIAAGAHAAESGSGTAKLPQARLEGGNASGTPKAFSQSGMEAERHVDGPKDARVTSLLVALARADPSGDTIRSLQRWAHEAIMPEQVIK